MKSPESQTVAVDDTVFRRVYDSPAALPGRHRWLTRDQDVREIEQLLGMRPQTIGAPLWVSGDRKTCTKCRRQISWLDIVASGTAKKHSPAMLANVILGEQKYVNTEAPRAIADVRCFDCGTAFQGLRSFKCHNWAYAKPALLKVIQEMQKARDAGRR